MSAALVCTVTAALGHLAGGGVMPSDTALIAFGGAAVISWSLSRRRLTVGQLAGLLVLCQLCVHFGSTSMNMSALMLATHVAATTASAVLLAKGEAFVWQVAERFGLRAVPALSRIRQPAPACSTALVHRIRSLSDVFLAHSRVVRGPPVAS